MNHNLKVMKASFDEFLAELEDQRYSLHSAVEGNDLDVVDYDDVRKAFSRIELKLIAQEKELREKLEQPEYSNEYRLFSAEDVIREVLGE